MAVIPVPPMIASAIIAEMANHAENQPWPSLEWAGWIFDKASFVLIGSLVVGAAATVAIVWMGIVKEHHWDLLRDEANQQIGQLFKDGESLKKDAEQLRKETAEANARTAEAELKLEQLRTLAAPRGLNHEIFAKEIAGKPKAPVEIWYLPDASDSWQFAFHLEMALHEAGWQIDRRIPIPDPPPTIPWRDMPRAMVAGGQPAGITVVGSDIEMGEPAFKALFEALAKSTNFGMYGSGGSQAMPVPKGTLRVVIAAKTDPMFRPQTNQPNSK